MSGIRTLKNGAQRERMLLSEVGWKVECDLQRQCEFCDLAAGESCDEVRQQGLLHTDQIIAVETAILFQAVFHPQRHLGRQTIVSRVNRRADNA